MLPAASLDGAEQNRAGGVPRQARALATRQRLLDATLDVLFERGYADTTTIAVCEQAGLSRGTQLHHFASKAELVRATIEHLAVRRADEIRAEARRLGSAHADSGGDRIDVALGLLERTFTGKLFVVALEVWVAARTDSELRLSLAPLEQRIGRELSQLTLDVLGADGDDPQARQAVQLTLDLMRGLGLAGLLTEDRQRRVRVLGWHGEQLRRLLSTETRDHPTETRNR